MSEISVSERSSHQVTVQTVQNQLVHQVVGTSHDVQFVTVFVDPSAAQMAQEAIVRSEQILGQTIDLIQNIDNRNTILYDAGFLKSGQQITANAHSRWNIAGVMYENSVSNIIQIPYSTSLKSRWVRICMTRDNSFVRVDGVEALSNPPVPVLPDHMLSYTFFLVTDNSIGEPSTPITGDLFKSKLESGILQSTIVGSLPNIRLDTEMSHVVFTNASSISSFHATLNQKIYPGKRYQITNQQNKMFSISHQATGVSNLGNIRFFFPQMENYVMLPFESVEFYLSQDLTTLYFMNSNRGSGISKVVSSNVQIDNSFHNATVFVSNSCTLTYPSPDVLIPHFNLCIRTMGGVTLQQTFTSGWTNVDAPTGKVLLPLKMGYISRVAATNTIIVEGEFTS